MAEALRSPSSVSEVDELVQRLYQPGNPSEIISIQETLQKLQRSPEGWQLADALLSSEEERVRFFGALTFTVKLNADWETLDDAGADLVLYRLLQQLVRLTLSSERQMVLKKLCSTLVIFVLRFPSRWQRCVRHVIFSLYVGEVLPLEALAQTVVPNMDDWSDSRRVVVALWFSTILAEEIGKTDSTNIRDHKYHELMLMNQEDVVSLIRYALSREYVEGQSDEKVARMKNEAIKCLQVFISPHVLTMNRAIDWLQSWVFYSLRASTATAVHLNSLTAVTPMVLSCITQETLFDSTVDYFTDVLSNYPRFFTAENYSMLSLMMQSPWSQDRLARLKVGECDFDNLQYGRLLLAFGDATLQHIVRNPDNDDSRQVMTMMHNLSTCNGYPVAEDEICAQALEYWTNYVEFVVCSEEPEQDALWRYAAREHITQAIYEFWRKSRVPDSPVFAGWDPELRSGFKEFRKDVADFLQSTYPLLGAELFRMLVDMALTSLSSMAWDDLEATLFFLSKLNDCMSEGQEDERQVETLLTSAEFMSFLASAKGIPGKISPTLVDLLGSYAAFYERHTAHLAVPLRFLFQCVEVPSMALDAARSISMLCSSCRQVLVPELGAFIQQYEHISNAQQVDVATKTRILGAIASIIQTLALEEDKARRLQSLLVFVGQDVYACLNHAAAGRTAEAEESGVQALQALASIGKGLQAPEDVPIDLDSDTPPSTYWSEGAGSVIQNQIIEALVKISDALPQSGPVIEAASSVLKTGFSEATPGPFVFSPAVATQFLLRANINTPRLGLVLMTACTLISSHSTDSSTRIDREAEALFAQAIGFIGQLGDPENDPEIAQNCVDLIYRLVHRYMHVMVQFQPPNAFQNALVFSLRCLAGFDILPKRAAAQLWVSLLIFQDAQPHIQAAVDQVILNLGPALAESLILNVGGKASRSELDTLVDPLKRLVVRQRESRGWLEAALFGDSFPSGARVDDAAKRSFLQRIMTLRGSKGTNQAVKEFWVASRGMNFAYTS